MLIEKLGFALRRFIISLLFLQGVSHLLHIAEIAISGYSGQIPFSWEVVCYALLNDILFIAHFGLIALPIYIFIYLASDFTARMIMAFALIVVICVQIGLMQYYLVSGVPLGADFWSYSWQDIKLTVTASASISWWQIILFPAFLGLALRAHYAMQQHTLSLGVSSGITGFYACMIITSFIFTSWGPADTNFKNLSLDKADYFLLKSREYYSENYADRDQGPVFLSNNSAYPFQIAQNPTDNLGKYFNPGTRPPNIVVILVEGLGKTFVGANAEYKGCMPFLDSLSAQSLFWTNFLSTTGRTFGVLPSVTGSLPYGKTGFMDLGDAMPHHTSLISLLKQNGYRTGFYYGGDASFDNQKMFLERQGIDYILDEDDYPENYTKIPPNSGGFSWGYPDKELYRRSFEVLGDSSPYLSIYLTVTTHEPFKFSGSEAYEQRLNTFMASNKNRDMVSTNKDAFKTLMYADDALRYFIETYKQRSDYQNTIFIITGDHRMIPVQHKNAIDRYHVPFIMFSPMLKGPQVFRSISSHADLPSTMVAYLQHQHRLNFPDSVHWLGKGLTFNNKFSNDKELAIMRNKGDISEYVSGTYFLTDGALLKIDDNMTLEREHDEDVLNIISAQMQQFKGLNNYVCSNNKLYSVTNTNVARDPSDTSRFAPQPVPVAEQPVKKDSPVSAAIATTPPVTRPAVPQNQVVVKNNRAGNAQQSLTQARAFAAKNDYGNARKSLDQALMFDPNNRDVYITAIDIELGFGRKEDARSWYYKAISQFDMESFKPQLERIKAYKK